MFDLHQQGPMKNVEGPHKALYSCRFTGDDAKDRKGEIQCTSGEFNMQRISIVFPSQQPLLTARHLSKYYFPLI